MLEIVYYPRLGKGDYDELLQKIRIDFLADLDLWPADYEAWWRDFDERKETDAARGDFCDYIDITPDDFLDFCRHRPCAPTPEALETYAAEIT